MVNHNIGSSPKTPARLASRWITVIDITDHNTERIIMMYATVPHGKPLPLRWPLDLAYALYKDVRAITTGRGTNRPSMFFREAVSQAVKIPPS